MAHVFAGMTWNGVPECDAYEAVDFCPYCDKRHRVEIDYETFKRLRKSPPSDVQLAHWRNSLFREVCGKYFEGYKDC